MASGKELQLLVSSGLWQHMDFRRVHRSLIYRVKPDGQTDIHRVLANVEDVLKTRMLPPLDKAKVFRPPSQVECSSPRVESRTTTFLRLCKALAAMPQECHAFGTMSRQAAGRCLPRSRGCYEDGMLI